MRITKVPAGVSSILVEAGPNPANDNSAVWVNYQVGRGGDGGGGGHTALADHCWQTLVTLLTWWLMVTLHNVSRGGGRNGWMR